MADITLTRRPGGTANATRTQGGSSIEYDALWNGSINDSLNDPAYIQQLLAGHAIEGGGTFPKRGQAYPNSPFLFFTEAEVSEGPLLYRVRARYETLDWQNQKKKDEPDPFKDPLEAESTIEWFNISTNEPISCDSEGVAIVNPCGQAYDPPDTIDYNDRGLRVSVNRQEYDPLVFDLFNRTMCKTTFLGYPMYTFRWIGETAVAMIKNEFAQFWRVTGTFHVRRNNYAKDNCYAFDSGSWVEVQETLDLGWALKKRCEGFLAKNWDAVSNPPAPVFIKDDGTITFTKTEGVRPQEPVLLSIYGYPLVKLLGREPKPNEVHYQVFLPYVLADYSFLKDYFKL
jgi:hypothetical protein